MRLVIILSASLLFLGVSKLHSQSIEGVWVFNSEASFAKVSPAVQEHLSKNPALKANIENAYIGKRISFLANGDYRQQLSNGKAMVGKWSIQKNILSIVSPEGVIFQYNFNLAENNLLISDIATKGQSSSMVPNQYFTKL